MRSPLKGVRVIDCTHVLAAPFAGRVLAEFGAEVIKVERTQGELARNLGELYFSMINANKKVISINLKTEKGRELLYELVHKSDVFLTNYRDITVRKLKISYEDLKKVNPKIIYAHLTGFGLEGLYKDIPAHDILIQGLSGMCYCNGFPDDPPVRCGPPVIDYGAGLYLALAVCAALYHREKNGKGQLIDVSLYDTAIMFLLEHLFYFFSGFPTRLGSGIPMQAPYNIYRAKDGYVAILADDNNHWYALLRIMGREDLIKELKYDSFEKRVKYRKEIDELIQEWCKNISVKDAEKLMLRAEFPIAPVRHISEIFNDPQVKLRRMLTKLKHPELGEIWVPGTVPKFSETPTEVKFPGYPLGYHTREVLKNLLGYSDEKIEKLEKEGIIKCYDKSK